MPVYPKSRGRWRVVIHHRGERKDWIVEGTKRDALAFEARKRVELEREGPRELRVAPKFSDFCLTSYTPHAKTHLKQSTWKRARKYQVATLVEFFGDTKLNALTPQQIEGFKTWRAENGCGHGTINDDLKVLSAILAFARDMGVPVAEPRIKRLPPKPRRPPRAWGDAEMTRLFRAVKAKSPDILELVMFLANTGCRKGEALALTWENVDRRRRLIRIWPSDEWQPKDGEPREVPIGAALSPVLSRGGEGPVFPSSAGTAYAVWPQRKFDRARRAARLTGGPHTLRHTFASHFLAQQPDLYLLAKILGHSHERVTANYAHLLPDHLERARDAVVLVPEDDS